MRTTGATGLVVAFAGNHDPDAVLEAVRARLADDQDIVFPRRVITRPIATSDELHQSVTPAQFEELRRNDRFLAVWSEGGRNFALPREVSALLAHGKCVVVPVAAAGVSALCRTVPHVALLRLDSPEDRLEDEVEIWCCEEDIVLTMHADLSQTVEAAVTALRRLAHPGGRRMVQRPAAAMSPKSH